MRRVARFTCLSIVLLLPLLSGFARGQYVGVPGPGPVAPAPDIPAYSVPSGETLEPSPPSIHAEDIWKTKQEAASGTNIAPGSVQIDPGGSDDAFTLRASFNGIDLPPGSGASAADPTIAAGPTKLVLASNHLVEILDKTGRLVDSTRILDFFGYARLPGESAGDPRVVFDPGSSRFFIVASGRILNPSCTPGTCVAHLFLAVSKTSNPTTLTSADWYFYAFDGTLDGATLTVYWSDFPGLGVDDQVLAISSIAINQMGYTEYARIRILDKSKLINGETFTWTDFFRMTDPLNGATAINFQPALHFESPGTFFLVSASQAISCGLIVWGIENPLSSPTLSARTVTASGECNNPPDAPQPGADHYSLQATNGNLAPYPIATVRSGLLGQSR